MNPARRMLQPLASLKLTVVLLALAMFLVFAGTLAQVHQGIWVVVRDYFRSFVVWIDLQHFVLGELARVPLSIPFPGGFTLGSLLLANLLAAHAIRFKLTRRRAGILTLHAGILLLLLGELTTALFAKEGNMSIDEGSYANFTENLRRVELAVIDPSNPDHDEVVVVPQPMLERADSVIEHEQLPFSVRVDRWMHNSSLSRRESGPAGGGFTVTAGFGTRLRADPAPPVTGVEEQTVDAPSAYLTLSRGGQTLGTWLVSLYIDQPQEVSVEGKVYHIGLRFEREYKPYTIHLIDFKHDKFIGTEKPRNFSSLIRLVDPERHEDREVLIYMNHPLRYRGETFYQSAFKPGDIGTVLQVVRNPGWLMPYGACKLVSLGMLIHFGSKLATFLRRARA